MKEDSDAVWVPGLYNHKSFRRKSTLHIYLIAVDLAKLPIVCPYYNVVSVKPCAKIVY